MKISDLTTEDTYQKLNPEQKEAAVQKEILPYFILAAIPIIITIFIAKTFGPAF